MENHLRRPWRWPAAVAAGLFLTSTLVAQPQPRPPAPPTTASGGDNIQELTRGPIHEAFGQPTVFNPVAGPVVAKRPPDLINEVPPDMKPEGDNVAWIPGYWAWDDESKGHLWVSGFWRAVPPGRTWMPGYWATVDGGYQWVSGYWATDQITEVEYLPPPPESLEVGPSTVIADDNQVWIPGVWVWRDTRYWWRPGFWTTANPDWVWVPAHYGWTPNGYVFVEGYCDYPLFNRGLLFAPAVFTSIPADFAYTPSVVIDTRLLASALFVRPAVDHYYFGDYYDPSYSRAGIYPWFAFHGSRFGYDPLFVQTNYVYSRRDPQWSARMRETFATRREHLDARPPHNLRQFNDWVRRVDPDGREAVAFVTPLADVRARRDYPVRLERLDDARMATVRRQSEQVQKFRTERIRYEEQAARDARAGTTADPRAPQAGRATPARLRIPEAPRLTQTPEGVGGRAATPKGTPTGTPTTARSARPPEPPRLPELAPPGSVTQTAPKGGRTALPHPDDNLRPPANRAAPEARPRRAGRATRVWPPLPRA